MMFLNTLVNLLILEQKRKIVSLRCKRSSRIGSSQYDQLTSYCALKRTRTHYKYLRITFAFAQLIIVSGCRATIISFSICHSYAKKNSQTNYVSIILSSPYAFIADFFNNNNNNNNQPTQHIQNTNSYFQRSLY